MTKRISLLVKLAPLA